MAKLKASTATGVSGDGTEQLDALLELAGIIRWELDLESGKVTGSPALSRIYPGLIEGGDYFTYILSMVHPEDRSLAEKMLEGWLGGALPSGNMQFRMTTPDGQLLHIQCSGKVFYNGSGKPVKIAGITQDITEFVRLRDTARLSDERYRLLADSADDFIYVIDRDLRVAFLNAVGAGSIGMTPEQAKGMPLDKIFPPRTYEHMARGLRHVFETGESTSDMHQYTFFDREYWLHVRLTPIKDDAGRVTHVMGISRDISDRKAAEKALDEMRQKAELYVDLMGHDIINMNQIMLGYLEVLGQLPGTTDEHRALMEKPVEVLERSSRLISNVRKLQKISQEGARLEPVDLGRVIGEAIAQYSEVRSKSVTIEHAPFYCCMVMADALLYDIFANLIDNSIKHSAGPKVEIRIRVDPERRDGREYYTVAVEDNGPGIADQLKPRIFNRPLQGSTSAKGSGIGLYLVKKLVDSYHGFVWVEDRVRGDRSRGSRFVVMLPAAV
jgi:PAS domain S-box-containing protein